MGFGHPCGDRTDADLGNELHMHARARIGILEIVDELSQILDGIDIVVRRWRDESDTGRRVAHLRDRRVHLVSGELPTFAGLCALRHLDLQIVGIDQVFTGHAESSRRNLLDSTAP